MDITEILTLSAQQGASDLHISAGLPPVIRIDGALHRTDLPSLEPHQVDSLIYQIMNNKQRKDFEQFIDIDFSFAVPDVARFRVNVFHQDRGSAAVFRTIPTQINTLEQLGMGDIFRQLCLQPRGLVLVTGPTGSGKSTSMAAMVDYINENRCNHILTFEDPIEFVHLSKKCLINQRQIHRDAPSFDTALRSALREDPDVLVIGELRDLQTIRLALTAAETGHLVLATMHTASAIKTIDRVVDVFPVGEKSMVRSMLAESLQAVISQLLVTKEGGGRVAAHEIMIGSQAVRNLIREDKLAQLYSSIQTGSAVGMQTLDQSLSYLVEQGIIKKDVARTKAKFPDNF
jgi:twitching motility protein PilT